MSDYQVYGNASEPVIQSAPVRYAAPSNYSNPSLNVVSSQRQQIPQTISVVAPLRQSQSFQSSLPLRNMGLTSQATHVLKSSADRYMLNQEAILKATKMTQDMIKELDERQTAGVDQLQINLRNTQDRLQKQHQENLKNLRENVEQKKRALQKRIQELNELQGDSQKKYFESQEDAIKLYKKTAQKTLNMPVTSSNNNAAQRVMAQARPAMQNQNQAQARQATVGRPGGQAQAR